MASRKDDFCETQMREPSQKMLPIHLGWDALIDLISDAVETREFALESYESCMGLNTRRGLRHQ
jgi:hypothetical protein